MPSVRLDDFFGSSMARRHQYSLLKVDVEGFELDVLFSAERLIRMNAISNVIVETGGKARWSRAGRSSADARRLLDLFDESGFQCRALRMWHSPTKDFMTPGHAKFDTALASWPVRSVRSEVAGKDATFEYTIIEPRHFGHFVEMLELVDFNLWFALPRPDSVHHAGLAMKEMKAASPSKSAGSRLATVLAFVAMMAVCGGCAASTRRLRAATGSSSEVGGDADLRESYPKRRSSTLVTETYTSVC